MFDMMSFIERLTAIYHRQLEAERRAQQLIEEVLKKSQVIYRLHSYPTKIPVFQATELLADGVSVPAIATSFVSGEIYDKCSLLSSLMDAQKFRDDPNINFNPLSKGISRGEHFFAPAVAIARHDLQRVCEAERVHASVRVRGVVSRSTNIMVGNLKDPQSILFCHYDSIGPGATDNASGTAVLLKLLLDYPETLTHTLYVIAGNEEFSYDRPIYWGRGYRAFETKYPRLFAQAKRIYCVDCVGNGPTTIEKDVDMIRYGFPIKGLERYIKKTRMFYGSFEKLMQVYHSDLDTIDQLELKYLDESVQIIHDLVSERRKG